MRNFYFYRLSENGTHCTQSEKEVFDLLAWVIQKNVKCVWLHSIFANKIITKYWFLILLTTRRPLSRRPTVRFPTGPGKELPVWWGRSEHVRGEGGLGWGQDPSHPVGTSVIFALFEGLSIRKYILKDTQKTNTFDMKIILHNYILY